MCALTIRFNLLIERLYSSKCSLVSILALNIFTLIQGWPSTRYPMTFFLSSALMADATTRTTLFASRNAAVDDRELFLGSIAMIGRHSFGEHRGTTSLAVGVQSDHSPVGWSQKERERLSLSREGNSSPLLTVDKRVLRVARWCWCATWNDRSLVRCGAVSTFQSDVNTELRSGSSASNTVDGNGHAWFSEWPFRYVTRFAEQITDSFKRIREI